MTTRIGIVGAGNIARSHVNALRRVPDCTLSGVFDVDDAKAKEFAATYDAPVLPSDEAVIDASDAVYVCTWTAGHRPVVERAAAAGKAIFCEKPLAPTLADASAMAAAVTEAGVINQVGLPLRWWPELLLLRHLLADPANGRILTATLHSEIPTRQRVRSSWRGNKALAGGGMLIEVGFHDLDLLQWLIAPINGLGARTIMTEPGSGIEEAASLALEFADGSIGSLVVVWHDATGRPQTRGLQIVCEYAYFQLDLSGPERRLSVTGPGVRSLTFETGQFAEQIADLDVRTDPDGAFVDAVRANVPAAPNIADALDVHVLIDAAYRSATDGTTWTRPNAGPAGGAR